MNRSFLLLAALGFSIVACTIFGVNIPDQADGGKQTSRPSATVLPATPAPVLPTASVTALPDEPVIVPTAVFTPGIGSTTISPKDGMVLVYVPAGEFLMGSDTSDANQRPLHRVYLDAFWIDQTEVTNSMYAKCLDDKYCGSPAFGESVTGRRYFMVPEFDNYPMIYVSWNDAQTYCSWAGRRLPTEAEWEKAARGEDGNLYPWGNSLPNDALLNYNGSVGDTVEVRTYPGGKSVYGAFDLAGNVWEWVYDLYDPSYYRYSPASNPAGPASGQMRVIRGGTWYSNDLNVRSSLRYWEVPTASSDRLGFRCAYADGGR